ncbi:hypothetical protein BKA81DRAFT_354121 [Phyllosticta paracitricarpa]
MMALGWMDGWIDGWVAGLRRRQMWDIWSRVCLICFGDDDDDGGDADAGELGRDETRLTRVYSTVRVQYLFVNCLLLLGIVAVLVKRVYSGFFPMY